MMVVKEAELAAEGMENKSCLGKGAGEDVRIQASKPKHGGDR